MKPHHINLALAEDQIAKAQEDLWEVQLKEYPDSVRMTLEEVQERLQEDPPYLEAHMKWWDKQWEYFTCAPEFTAHRSLEKLKTILDYQLRMSRSVALCAIQDPCGFFYKCGKTSEGAYRWTGFRYGLEPQDYMSGFN